MRHPRVRDQVTPMDRDPADVRLDRLFLGSMGWSEHRDGFEQITAVVDRAAPEAKQFLDRLMALAEEATALGLWETPRALLRARFFAIAELRQTKERE